MATRNRPYREHPQTAGLEKALAELKPAAGIDARLCAAEAPPKIGARADAIIEIKMGGIPHTYIVDIKGRVDRRAALGPIKAQLYENGDDHPGLLYAPYLTTDLADACRAMDLQFLDGAGNAFLRTPEFYLFIKGEKPNENAEVVTGVRGAGTATAIRVVFALVNKPQLLTMPYKDIVAAAGVAMGAVGRVLLDLTGRGYVTARTKKRKRRFLEPQRLIDEWITNYPITLRPKLNPQRFRAMDPMWWKQVQLPEHGAYWGGEVAADRLTGHLKPATQTIYLDPATRTEALGKLAREHRWQRDPAGPIEVLDTFWNWEPDHTHRDVVPPLLAYADLMATFDPRNNEVAAIIRAQHLDNARYTH